jgi:hypothetical protein
MLRSDAAALLSSRADLAVLGDAGRPCLVVQRRQCEDWYVVVARRRSATSARAWIEAHYEEVRWRSPVECTARVGRMRAGAR